MQSFVAMMGFWTCPRWCKVLGLISGDKVEGMAKYGAIWGQHAKMTSGSGMRFRDAIMAVDRQIAKN